MSSHFPYLTPPVCALRLVWAHAPGLTIHNSTHIEYRCFPALQVLPKFRAARFPRAVLSSESPPMQLHRELLMTTLFQLAISQQEMDDELQKDGGSVVDLSTFRATDTNGRKTVSDTGA